MRLFFKIVLVNLSKVEEPGVFTIGQGSPWGLYLEPQGHLEVVAKCLTTFKGIILMILSPMHISVSEPTPMSFKF